MSERVGLFEEDEDFSVAGFEPTPPLAKEKMTAATLDAVRALSEASQFRSRESPVPKKKREPMRHRTGRNAQLNVKLRAETIESFYEIARQHKWTLGETLEHALAALQTGLAQN